MQEKNGYFEPNLVDYNPEDLCYGIALRVEYTDRSLNNSTVLTGQTNISPSENILGGDNGLLSTSYSDISVLELSGGGNRESIGIESINIKYNSWYFPEVTIKFVDIRGNSVLNPMELTNNKNAQGESEGKGSFLRGFFMFPYPIFYLSVKGYFGKPVTYRLTVKGVPQATFDSSSGNFDITVNFIGHMYYYLTDIPMSFLLVAPYICYSGVSSVLDDQQMTFRDFVSKSAQLINELKANSTISNNYIEYDKLKTTLGQLELLKTVLNETEKILSHHFTQSGATEDGKTIFVSTVTGSTVAAIADREKHLKGIFSDGVYRAKKIQSSVSNNTYLDLVIAKNDNAYNPERDRIEIFWDYDNDSKMIKNNSEDIRSEMAKISSVNKTEKEELYDSTYGFVPTIREIVKMAISHLNKLHENVNACLLNISNESGERKLIDVKENTDINVSGSKNITVYPFTQFYDYEGKQMWIGNTSARGYAEVSLVNALFRGLDTFNNEMSSAENEFLYNTMFVYNSPPTGLYSLLSDVGKPNPYKEAMEKRNLNLHEFCIGERDDGYSEMLSLFAKRYFLASALCNDENYVKNVFPKIEAYNLLACGWNESVYNNETIFGNDEDDYTAYKQQFVKMFEKALHDIQLEMESATKQGEEKHEWKKTLCPDEIERTDTFSAYTKLYNSIKLKQHVVVNHYWYPYRHTSLGATVPICTDMEAEERFYMKTPTEVFIDDVHIDKDISAMNTYLSDKGITGITIFNKRPPLTILTPKKNVEDSKDIISFNIDSLTADSDANEILDALFNSFTFGDPTSKQSLLSNLNEGGIIPFRWLELLMVIRWTEIYDPQEEKSTENLQLYKYFSNLSNALTTDFYYNRRDELLRRFRDILEIGQVNENLNRIYEETVDVYFPYSFKDGVFNVSAGIEGEERWYGVDIASSLEVNKANFAKYHGNGAPMEKFLNTIRQYVEPEIAKNEEIRKQTVEEQVAEIKAHEAQKMSIYDTFKNLYDRWKFGANSTIENNIKVDDFIFRDILGRDIGDELEINLEKVVSLLLEIYKGERDMDLYSFLFEICKETNCLMLSLPFNSFGATADNKSMREMFTPYQYSTIQSSPQRSKFVITYRQKPSEHLSFSANESGYKDDGIDFRNETVTSEDNELTLPVFGVTCGMQKQSIFKEIQVSMDKPKVTEQSIASTLAIAENGAKSSQSLQAFSSHDIFDTYSQHSYQCTVETMGNMQIMPMMYFQLNNIPLFKGGYFITKVEHQLNNNGMKTTFTGNRVNKYQLVLAKNAKIVMGDGIQEGSGAGNFKIHDDEGKEVTRYFPTLTFSKENTVIIIRPTFGYDTPGQESPLLTEDGFMAEDAIKTAEDEIFQPYNEKLEITNKFRSYWGNRKLADSLAQKLRDNGYVVDTREYYKTKDAKERNTFDNAYTRQVNGKEMNCICINLSMDSINNKIDSEENPAEWGTGNRWVIYHQKKYNSVINSHSMPYAETSEKLAKCIATQMSESFTKVPYGNFVVDPEPTTMLFEGKTTAFANAQMPSVYGVNLYASTKEHVRHIAKKEFREQIVTAYYNGIVKFFEEMKDKYISPQGTKDTMYGRISTTQFTWSEMLASDTAKKFNISNIPNERQQKNITQLCEEILEPIRLKYKTDCNKSFKVNSGFRSEELNGKMGGSSTSQHKTGSAADIENQWGINNGELFKLINDMISNNEIEVGQLIWEHGDCENPDWIHVSLPNAGKKNEILRAKEEGGKTVYVIYEPCNA